MRDINNTQYSNERYKKYQEQYIEIRDIKNTQNGDERHNKIPKNGNERHEKIRRTVMRHIKFYKV
jgi:hypothetical protein